MSKVKKDIFDTRLLDASSSLDNPGRIEAKGSVISLSVGNQVSSDATLYVAFTQDAQAWIELSAGDSFPLAARDESSLNVTLYYYWGTGSIKRAYVVVGSSSTEENC